MCVNDTKEMREEGPSCPLVTPCVCVSVLWSRHFIFGVFTFFRFFFKEGQGGEEEEEKKQRKKCLLFVCCTKIKLRACSTREHNTKRREMRSALNASSPLGIQCASSSSSSSFKDESASSSSAKKSSSSSFRTPERNKRRKKIIVQPNVASISSSSSSLNNTNLVSAAMVVVGLTGTAVAIASLNRAGSNNKSSGRRTSTTKATTKDVNTSSESVLQHTSWTAKALKTFNEETKEKYVPNFPEVVREDAHVYKDEDGYYVVKEEWQKPTNPFEKLKLAKGV